MPKQPPSRLAHDSEDEWPLFYSWRRSDEGGGFDMKSSPESTSVTGVIQIDFMELNRARRMLLGYPTVKVAANGVKYISRNLPFYFPPSLASAADSPMSPLLFARAITRTELVGPRGGWTPDGFPLSELARLSITFSKPPYDLHPDDDLALRAVTGSLAGQAAPDESSTRTDGTFVRFVRRTTDPEDRSISIPMATMRFILEPTDPGYLVTPAPPLGVGPALLDAYAVQEPRIQVAWAHYERPELPLQRIITTMGATNKTAFNGFAAKTLVLMAPRVRCYVGAHGDDVFDVTFRAAYTSKVQAGSPPVVKSVNHFLRAIKQASGYSLGYRELSSTGLAGGDRLFREMEFRDLFLPDA